MTPTRPLQLAKKEAAAGLACSLVEFSHVALLLGSLHGLRRGLGAGVRGSEWDSSIMPHLIQTQTLDAPRVSGLISQSVLPAPKNFSVEVEVRGHSHARTGGPGVMGEQVTGSCHLKSNVAGWLRKGQTKHSDPVSLLICLYGGGGRVREEHARASQREAWKRAKLPCSSTRRPPVYDTTRHHPPPPDWGQQPPPPPARSLFPGSYSTADPSVLSPA
ncbi:hypothetical protein SKAU_G00074800 [Synaphobranchus kaupii]|uniref:Uncharacterized protein n=1 Tax=Synaphobranchus kaupii TaxID=118154 RepID=A0A9Q1G7N2_SYNKA|nr:hypothetical protein SKAU_G00074800 [Synaphobranchus kaupii]